ncbi:MAG: chondroitin AC lyase [Opitutae bacterium]|nr:chondroitin AC lyase [Opitutae bacterium]
MCFSLRSKLFSAVVVSVMALLWVAIMRGAELGPGVLLERQREVLLSEVLQPAPVKMPSAAQVKIWTDTLGIDDRWPDIDYAQQDPSAWQVFFHLDRVRAMCLALASMPDTSVPPQLMAAIDRALDHWNRHRYQSHNWWFNEIGIPGAMRDIVVLLGERLTGERRAGVLAVLRQARVKPVGQGANTIWAADLGLFIAAIQGDTAQMAAMRDVIAGEIRVTTGEGIQADFSFYQHGPRLQLYHYGAVFFQATARLAWQLRGTPWALPEEKVWLLSQCLLEGAQWMVRGTATVPGTLDRMVSRPGALRGADLCAALRFLRDVLPERASEFDAFAARQAGGGEPLTGFRAFPRADFAAYHRKDFSFFLKTVSTRTALTESINRENLRGGKLHYGDHYLLRDGAEYADLPPVWDWDLLPGVTWAAGAGVIQRQAFTGAVGDGTSGAMALDYRCGEKDRTALAARKFWACHDGTIVCLMGGLQTNGKLGPVRTALDQCRWRGPVTVADARGDVRELSEGEHAAAATRWLHHAGFAYFPLAATPVAVRLTAANGSWAAINRGQSDAPVTERVFLPILEHGPAPANAATGFAVRACVTTADTAAVFAAPPWHVLRNDSTAQAVQFADGTLMAVFYAAGEVARAGAPRLAADAPCLVLWRGGELRASDPTQRGSRVQLRVGDRSVTVACPADGSSSPPLSL